MRLPRLVLAFLLIAGSSPPFAAGGHTANPLVYDVLEFLDPDDLEQEMMVGSPSPSAPQTGTCDQCPANAPLTYLFHGPIINATNQYRIWASGGEFQFWIRTHQPNGLAGVPPGNTRIRFGLATSEGAFVGQATVSKNIQGLDPVSFATSFSVAEVLIPAGAHLVWNVTIDDGAGLYEPAAAPFGVSGQYRFQVRLPRPQLVGAAAEVSRHGAWQANVTVGDDVRFAWRARNLGPGPADFNIILGGDGSGSGVSDLRPEPNVSVVRLAEGETYWGNVTAHAEAEGSWAIRLLFYNPYSSPSSGSYEVQFLLNAVRVPEADATVDGATPDPDPGPGSCLGPASGFRVSTAAETDFEFSCRLESLVGPVEWRIRLEDFSGILVLRWVDSQGTWLESALGKEGEETVRIDPPGDGIVRLVVDGHDFRGSLDVAVIVDGQADAKDLGAVSAFDPGAALPALAILAVGILATVGLFALWRRE